MAQAISHLNNFCAAIPGTKTQPVYEFAPDPTSSVFNTVQPYSGGFEATVTLPRNLPIRKRTFGVDRLYRSKEQAKRAVAFEAYIWLHQEGLLNDHLMPLTSVLEPEKEDELVRLLTTAIGKRAGLVGVGGQMNPWLPTPTDLTGTSDWFRAQIRIGKFPPLYMFTQRQLAEWNGDSGHCLYYPESPTPLRTEVYCRGSIPPSSVLLTQAREYTRRLFWSIYAGRMDRDASNFPYLFLPVDSPTDDFRSMYQAWADEHNQEGGFSDQDLTLVNAAAFGEKFGYRNNISMVKNTFKNGKPYRFLRWHHEKLEESEEELLGKRYQRIEGFEVRYPLLVVIPYPPRTNYLIPPSPKQQIASTVASEGQITYLAPQHSAISLVSSTEATLALILPSFLRALSLSVTVEAMRAKLWSSPSFAALASIPSSLLKTAITCPTAADGDNYQRLEMLGDTVLKFSVSCQLLDEYPTWHEGYLSKRIHRAVSNLNLAKRSIELEMFLYIIRDRLLLRKWKPEYLVELSKVEDRLNVVADASRAKETEKLSTKTLGDVVESLIGAAYLHGDVDLGLKCCEFFDLGIPWRSIPVRVESLVSRVPEDSRDNIPTHLPHVEAMLGYTFHRKLLLVEALTHTSYDGPSSCTPSYERLEFLGDAVIDMVTLPHLYHAEGKNYAPGKMSLRKSAMVNASTLGYFLLRASTTIEKSIPQKQDDGSFIPAVEQQHIFLRQCILHFSHRMIVEERETVARLEEHQEQIQEAFERGHTFPWGELVAIQAPKFFSDVFESIIGAVFLDSGGNLSVVRGVLWQLGWMQALERVANDEMSVQHPVSRLHQWAAKSKKKLEYDLKVDEETGNVSCRVILDGEETAKVEAPYKGKPSKTEVKLAAADIAFKRAVPDSEI